MLCVPRLYVKRGVSLAEAATLNDTPFSYRLLTASSRHSCPVLLVMYRSVSTVSNFHD